MKPILVFLTSILLCVSSPLFAEQQSEDEIAEEAANMAEKGAVNPSAAAIDVYRPATDISWFEDARF
ncbi:MAG: hypothetical protein HOI35_03940, partial [Woeseia sp.]|nr:hypothetical protein [Woeseia sp.]